MSNLMAGIFFFVESVLDGVTLFALIKIGEWYIWILVRRSYDKYIDDAIKVWSITAAFAFALSCAIPRAIELWSM